MRWLERVSKFPPFVPQSTVHLVTIVPLHNYQPNEELKYPQRTLQSLEREHCVRDNFLVK
jgi:hypothetical protein